MYDCIVWHVLLSYRPVENIPSLHSIETDLFDFPLLPLKRFLALRIRCKDKLLVDGNLHLIFG